MSKTCTDLDTFMSGLKKRNPGQKEFHAAVHEVASDVLPFIADNKDYQGECLLERLTEPDRIISFRVSWVDDDGNVRANRAWRVQFCNAIGPYKGGIRFHETVTESVLKFLGFEQTFKNSLTGLPMGGAKGGSNFNPKGKSDGEIMRFCQSMMTELHRYIGPDKDVPAGDIGVGAREIGYMFGQYRRLSHTFTGAMTGKGVSFGGSVGRKEATGHGVVYFMREMMHAVDDGIEGKTAVVSGSGNVALYCLEKLIQLGAKPLTASDSSGFIHDPDGIDEEKLDFIKDLKEVRRGRIKEYADKYGCNFSEGRPWDIKADLAFPCATQNELDKDDAQSLIDNGLIALAEGANMPCTSDAQHLLRNNVLYAPGKASNAGGVAVSGLEQSQNSQRVSWSIEEVDKRLQEIMEKIHCKCVKYGEGKDRTDYVRGANIGGFTKVADALQQCGVV
ncbi:glutamate dehydrogenase [Oceaniferula spumae]|uniref:Glutamate dehydrogenase n=1 Tax=Oceaniferula spumae TaxID=2979115 RepID=A0AAT9FMU7_9BACT